MGCLQKKHTAWGVFFFCFSRHDPCTVGENLLKSERYETEVIHQCEEEMDTQSMVARALSAQYTDRANSDAEAHMLEHVPGVSQRSSLWWKGNQNLESWSDLRKKMWTLKAEAEGDTRALLQKYCEPEELSKYGRCPMSSECAWTLKVINEAIGSKIQKISIVLDLVCRAFMIQRCTLEACIADYNDGFVCCGSSELMTTGFFRRERRLVPIYCWCVHLVTIFAVMRLSRTVLLMESQASKDGWLQCCPDKLWCTHTSR